MLTSPPYRRLLGFGLALLLVGACVSPSPGVLVSIHFRDVAYQIGVDAQNQPIFAGGPEWTGFVDTQQDTLTIESWTELPQSGPAFWTPAIPDMSSGPLVWHARGVDVNGVEYSFDVPDSFGANGEVSIGQDWGFVSPVSANKMDWINGDYVQVVDYFPGWGAQVEQPSQGVFRLKAGAEANDDSPYDETTLPVWPYDDSGFGIRAVLDATVTVLGIDASSAAVPEPGLFAVWALLAAVGAAKPRRR